MYRSDQFSSPYPKSHSTLIRSSRYRRRWWWTAMKHHFEMFLHFNGFRGTARRCRGWKSKRHGNICEKFEETKNIGKVINKFFFPKSLIKIDYFLHHLSNKLKFIGVLFRVAPFTANNFFKKFQIEDLAHWIMICKETLIE